MERDRLQSDRNVNWISYDGLPNRDLIFFRPICSNFVTFLEMTKGADVIYST